MADLFISWFMTWIMPILVGGGLYWIAGKCRGKNARTAFRYAAWSAWLWLLVYMWLPFPFLNLPVIGFILKATPSALCLLLAANSMLKEMRAQKVGQFTDAA